MSEETLTRLSDTLNQYTASALSNVSIPEFRGLPNEDVFAFLKRFKMATLSFSEELRCLALNKALLGAAHTWAKSNIKNLIATGAWKEAKKKIIDRFAPPDRELRYQERLTKLRYDPAKGTLTSYTEEYADVYKKAHGSVTDQDIIKSLSLNLPPNIIRHLNVLSDDWNSFSDLTDLYSLLRRLECKILPYEPKDTAEEKVDVGVLTRLIKEMKDSFEAQRIKAEAKNDEQKPKTEVVAALAKPNNYQYPPKEPNELGNNSGYQPYPRDNRGAYRINRRYENNRGWQPRFRQSWRNDNQANQNFGYQQPQNRGFGQSQPQNREHQGKLLDPKGKPDLEAAYWAKHGRPPRPCPICASEHFVRHCPYQDLN